MINASQFLIVVHPRHMLAQSIFALEHFSTVFTIVAEVTREVNTFNMVPCIVKMRVLFPTDVALVAYSPILGCELLQVLVKHLSSSELS